MSIKNQRLKRGFSLIAISMTVVLFLLPSSQGVAMPGIKSLFAGIKAGFHRFSIGRKSVTNPDPRNEKRENILLIDNHYDSDRPEDSVQWISALQSTLEHLGTVHRVHYTAFSDYIVSGQMRDKTLIVLSGGSGRFYENRYQMGHWYLRHTLLPVIGICQGLQILAKIFDNAGHYKLTDARLHMFENIDVLGMTIPMYYQHGWGVRLDDLHVMKSIANKDLCYGESCRDGRHSTAMAIYHPTRPVYAFKGTRNSPVTRVWR